MAKEIKITLLQELIINSVKNETYHRGQLTKAADEKNVSVAFQDQAGNEQHHEAILARAMFSQVEKLKTWFAEYLADAGGNIAEDALVDSEERTGAIDIILKVSDRFNNGYVKTLARLSQKYVEDRMLHLWWASSNKELSVMYAQIAEDDLAGIKRCFSKTAPAAPSYNFPTAITLTYPVLTENDGIPGIITPSNSNVVEPLQLLHNPWCISRGEVSEISYTLTGQDGNKPVDDIIIRCDNPCCVTFLSGGGWHIKGVKMGITIVTLFSRHDDRVFASFAVQVFE